MADEAENTPTVGTEETQGGTETAQTVWPDFGYPEERDAIDALIEALNAETGEVLTFERDALDVDRPEDWGAVEFVRVKNLYADDRVIDQCYQLEIWACVSDRDSEWLQRIEGVLDAQGDRLSYKFIGRDYLHNLKKALWHWAVTLWDLDAPEEPEPETETEPAEGDPPEETEG